MSEAKGALDSVKQFTGNISKHKGKVIIGAGLTAIALLVGYNVLTSNAELTISKELESTANQQSVRELGKQSDVNGGREIQYTEDETGINDANARLNELEEKSYQNRVYDAAKDDKSEIITREASSGNTKIRFKSDDKINKLEREKVVQDINIPDLATQDIIVPPKMVFHDEVRSEGAQATTYLTENYNEANLLAQESIVAGNVQAQITKLIQNKEKLEQNKTGENKGYKFSTTDVYDRQLEEFKAQQETEKELASKRREQELEMVSKNAMTASAQKASYIPSDTVVKTSKTATNMSQNGGIVLFKQGDIVSAITLMGATNLNLGPIKAQITEGEYAGAILNGTVTQGAERLLFNFTSMYLPNDPTLITISATVLKHDTLESGTYTNIDRKSFLKYIVKPTLKAGSAIGEYYANDTQTTATTTAGVVVQSNAEKSMKNAKKVGLGAAMEAVNQDIDEIDTTTIVTQEQYTPIKVYFTDEVIYKKSTENPSLSRENASNKYVQPLGQEQQFKQDQMLQQPVNTTITQ